MHATSPQLSFMIGDKYNVTVLLILNRYFAINASGNLLPLAVIIITCLQVGNYGQGEPIQTQDLLCNLLCDSQPTHRHSSI